ncbi:hypothetical protein NUU61_002043 [Penicillium alfredii]|uniref:Uncharacterized protein n=1 Tax=Penicillium alfredii TaxID=1506179 RepID=A0A9W9FQS8_9EURO|nr:uncharacterized protein NUU61_002043 [Penicillium alfredii]KAJ5104696.1 hypothetical protein NUU61_002043 [Penicillium alfredii]
MFLGFIQGHSLLKQDQSKYAMNQWGITWDPSCRDLNPTNKKETKQDFVKRAWAGAMELRPLSPKAQEEINKEDPAYVQFFALDWSKEGVGRIQSVLKHLALRANADPGTKRRPSELRSTIDINCKDKWMEDDKDECHKTLAFLENQTDPDDDTEWANSILNFCPDIWSLPRYDRLKTAAQVNEAYEQGVSAADYMLVRRNMYQDPSWYGTDATTVAPESTHVFWIGSTNEENERDICYDVDEIRGLQKCAEMAWRKGHPIPDNHRVTWNAPSYQNYLEYGRFVELMEKDLWPKKLKPVMLPVRYRQQGCCG